MSQKCAQTFHLNKMAPGKEDDIFPFGKSPHHPAHSIHPILGKMKIEDNEEDEMMNEPFLGAHPPLQSHSNLVTMALGKSEVLREIVGSKIKSGNFWGKIKF
jgi:hypothetical protein